MRPFEPPVFEKGNTYKMLVIDAFRYGDAGHIYVQHGSGQYFIVEVPGDLNQRVFSLKGKNVNLICVAVTEERPVFVLDVEFNGMNSDDPDQPSEKVKYTRGADKNLRVVYENGRVLFNPTAKATLIQFVKEVGADIIAPLNLKRANNSSSKPSKPLLVKYVPPDAKEDYTDEPVSCGYYLLTKSETQQKIEQIKIIIQRLAEKGLPLGVKTIELVQAE